MPAVSPRSKLDQPCSTVCIGRAQATWDGHRTGTGSSDNNGGASVCCDGNGTRATVMVFPWVSSLGEGMFLSDRR